MKDYKITVGFYRNVKEWELMLRSYNDEDDHIKFRRKTASGEDTEDTAKRFMDDLLANGGKIVRYADNPYAIGIEHNGTVYTNVHIWKDNRHAMCYEPYHFYK